MVHIAKTKTGFIVVTLADNGEVLNSTEVLSSKQKCWVNIRAHAKQWWSKSYDVQDDTGPKPVVKNFTLLYENVYIKCKSDIKPSKPYSPSKK